LLQWKTRRGRRALRAKEAKIAANDDESELDLLASLPNEMVLMILQPLKMNCFSQLKE